jgi:hypothetical protein
MRLLGEPLQERCIKTLEARQLVKSYAEKILEKLMDDELDRVGPVVEKIESGGVPTPDESAFLDELESK